MHITRTVSPGIIIVFGLQSSFPPGADPTVNMEPTSTQKERDFDLDAAVHEHVEDEKHHHDDISQNKIRWSGRQICATFALSMLFVGE